MNEDKRLMKEVLLIDDDKTSQFLNQFLLNKIGVPKENIHTVDNGKDAIDLLSGYHTGTRDLPDIIFLDLHMPILDGFGFLESFQRLTGQRKATIKIIVLSSSEHPGDIGRAMELGATHFAAKPLFEDDLRRILYQSILDQEPSI
jgi:CheY-like chemotaxis protein